MSEDAETPQQRQLRIRQAKREAKLKASGQERLDKITKLSGRTPESIRNDASTPPPTGQSPTSAAATPNTPSPLPSLFGQNNDAEQSRIQQEYIRAMLAGTQRDPSTNSQEQAQGTEEEDPMIKVLQSLLGGMSGDPNAPSSMPSAGDLSKITGIPPFVANMLFGSKQESTVSPAEQRSQNIWKAVRILFSILMGVYMIFTIEKSITTFGLSPSAPATMQNPFVVFLTGELLLYGSRLAISNQPAPTDFKSWVQSGRDFARDGAVLIFMLGWYSWSRGLT